jgi:hypothetical protein
MKRSEAMYFFRGRQGFRFLQYRFRIKRKWDQISDQMTMMLGSHGMIGGKRMCIVSVELSLDHLIIVEMLNADQVNESMHVPLKQVFRSIRRQYC